jgi:BirA family biotin operon repressor/biotin-[acetyl-CoA-carboxylase] ligase
LIGAIVAARRRLDAPASPLPWRLRGLAVCASTEAELDRWLEADPRLAGDAVLQRPRAVIARHQRFGRGQRGRVWSSPAGGVWLSAALPWPVDAAAAAAPGLAVAVGLSLRLEALDLPVRLKWPNDLLLLGSQGGAARKLAGLLPRLRLRGGRCRWARIGLGLNARNRVPTGAVALAGTIGPGRADPAHWSSQVLVALEWAMAWADRPEVVRHLAEQRLLLPAAPIRLDGDDWHPAGLVADGGLRLVCGQRQRVLRRGFGSG